MKLEIWGLVILEIRYVVVRILFVVRRKIGNRMKLRNKMINMRKNNGIL